MDVASISICIGLFYFVSNQRTTFNNFITYTNHTKVEQIWINYIFVSCLSKISQITHICVICTKTWYKNITNYTKIQQITHMIKLLILCILNCMEVISYGVAKLPICDVSWVNHWKHVSSIAQSRKCFTLHALWVFKNYRSNQLFACLRQRPI